MTMQKTEVFVTYHEECVKDVSEGWENGNWGTWETEYKFRLGYATTKHPGTPYFENKTVMHKKPLGPALWVVYGIYGDGDTFGSSSGEGAIVGVHASRLAAMNHKSNLEKNEKGEWLPWSGYFAHLEEIRVEPVTLALDNDEEEE